MAWGTDDNLTDVQFYNRTDDIEFLSNLLNSARHGSTPTILLTGIRGVGKTALIKKLQSQFRDDFLTVYIDMAATDAYQTGNLTRMSIIKLIYDELIKAIDGFGLKTLDKKLEKLFKTKNILINDIIDYHSLPLPLIKTEDDYTKLANFVMDLPQQLYEEYDEIKGVFLFIDEFQVIKELDGNLEGFLWYLRSKVQSQKNVSYLFSGSMSLKDELIEQIAGKRGAFGGRMLTVEIKPFSYETTKSYLSKKAAHLKFTEDGFKQFYTCTKGIPFYINTFANILPINEALNEKNLINLFKKSLPILAIHFISTWSKLTLQEQKIIIALLDKPLKRIEIANKLDVTSGSLSKPLNKLQDNVLIEIEDNKYQITDSILKEWLMETHDKKGIYPYRTI